MYAKQKFEKYYKKLHPLLYLASYPNNEYIFEYDSKNIKYIFLMDHFIHLCI